MRRGRLTVMLNQEVQICAILAQLDAVTHWTRHQKRMSYTRGRRAYSPTIAKGAIRNGTAGRITWLTGIVADNAYKAPANEA